MKNEKNILKCKKKDWERKLKTIKKSDAPGNRMRIFLAICNKHKEITRYRLEQYIRAYGENLFNEDQLQRCDEFFEYIEPQFGKNIASLHLQNAFLTFYFI